MKFTVSFYVNLLLLEFYDYTAAKLVSSSIGHSQELNAVYHQNYTVTIIKIPTHSHAVLFQAVSQGSIVLTSLQKDFSPTATTSGTSAGVISLLEVNHATSISFYVKVHPRKNCSANKSELVILFASSLNREQPLPGGCNLIQNANYFPVLPVSVTQKLIKVTFAPANVGFNFSESDPTCDITSSPNKRLFYDVYVYFLSYSYMNKTCTNCRKASFCNQTSMSSYFRKELDKLLLENTTSSGTKIASFNQSDKPVITFPITWCASAVIYINVFDPLMQTSSRYVPSIAFGGHRLNDESYTIFVKVVLIFFMIIGSLLCLFGHRLFAFELFLFGGIILALLSYISIALLDPSYILLSLATQWGIISGFAVVGGICLSAFWWRFGHPILLSYFIGIVGAFLLSCVIFITPLANYNLFRNETVFACAVVFVMAVYIVIMTLASAFRMCIITSSFVGSYMVVASLGCGVFVCSMMSQIVELMLYKISISQFTKAFVVLPLQANDIALIVVWCGLFIAGCTVQFFLQRSRSQFPECPYKVGNVSSVSHTHPSTASPLVQETCNDSDSLSSRGASYTSEHYEGDISDHDANADSFGLNDTSTEVEDTSRLLA